MNPLIFYTTDDGKSQIQLRADLGTVWLTQLEMAELFDATKQNISLHLKNLFVDGELDANSVVKESLTTATDTKKYRTQLYNLDAILAVGYRVRSPRGVQFRRWASTVLKEYLVKGFVMDDERLKNFALLSGTGSLSHARRSKSWSRFIWTLTNAARPKKPAQRMRRMRLI